MTPLIRANFFFSGLSAGKRPARATGFGGGGRGGGGVGGGAGGGGAGGGGGGGQSDGKFEICPPDLYFEAYSLHLRPQGCPSSALVTEQIKAQTLLHHYKLYSTL